MMDGGPLVHYSSDDIHGMYMVLGLAALSSLLDKWKDGENLIWWSCRPPSLPDLSTLLKEYGI